MNSQKEKIPDPKIQSKFVSASSSTSRVTAGKSAASAVNQKVPDPSLQVSLTASDPVSAEKPIENSPPVSKSGSEGSENKLKQEEEADLAALDPVPFHAREVSNNRASWQIIKGLLNHGKDWISQFKWGRALLEIPTPVILLVFFLSLAGFGFYLWEEGREILLHHISKSMILYISIITLVCVFILVMRHKDSLLKLLNGKSMLESRYYRYRHDVVYKIRITLASSMIMNMLFVCLKTVSGLIFHSAWFLTLAIYYLLLASLRSMLLLYLQRPDSEYSQVSEWRVYRMCGIVLLVMNHVLTGMVGYIVGSNNGFIYPGILLYCMAVYTAYALCSAIYSLIRYRKYGAPVLSAAKCVSLTAALVSLLALETAGITTFHNLFWSSRRFITASTGAIVCSTVLFLSIYMIVRSTIKIQMLHREEKKHNLASQSD